MGKKSLLPEEDMTVTFGMTLTFDLESKVSVDLLCLILVLDSTYGVLRHHPSALN